MDRPPYSTYLNDTGWQLMEPLLLPPKPGGRPITYPRREIVNAILRPGAAWRVLAYDLSAALLSGIANLTRFRACGHFTRHSGKSRNPMLLLLLPSV